MRRISRTSSRYSLVLGALLSLAGASACSPDFDPFNRVASLRVLGIKSEPPTPTFDQASTFSALVYRLPDDPPPTYTWSWCPFLGVAENGYQCSINGTPLTDEMLASLLAAARVSLGLAERGPPPSLSLGSDATATLTNVIEPQILTALCLGAVKGLPPQDCSDGFPFKVHLQVSTTGEHADTVDAVVTGHWSFTDVPSTNENPPTPELFARQGDDWQPVTDDTLLTLPRDKATRFEARLPIAAAQMYDGFNDDHQPAPLTERLFYTWYVESGSTDDSRTSYYPERTEFEALLKNTWTPGIKKNYVRDTARIFVVIHDNRGGVNWTQGTVNLEPTP